MARKRRGWRKHGVERELQPSPAQKPEGMLTAELADSLHGRPLGREKSRELAESAVLFSYSDTRAGGGVPVVGPWRRRRRKHLKDGC